MFSAVSQSFRGMLSGCSALPSAKRKPAKRLPFALYVQNDNHRPRLVKLVAMYGSLEIDHPAPAITVLPDEE